MSDETTSVEDKAVILPTPTSTSTTTAEPVATATTISDEDDQQVTDLKVMLSAFVDNAKKKTIEPKDAKLQAQIAANFTNFVIKNPKVPVLDALLSFFVENATGVCAPTTYLKGSTTLSQGDEQRVGVLYNLFNAIATKNQVRISNAFVIQILKKVEIVSYYNRKMAGIAAVANGTA